MFSFSVYTSLKRESYMEDLKLGMFKQYDIRTKIENLTESISARLYKAVALYYKDCVKADSVVIGRDARLYAPEVAEGLMNALRDIGIDVYLNPLPISTCQFYYTSMKHRASAGIMVTASHNPGDYIGLKLLSVGVSPIAFGCGPDGGIKKIRELYIDGQSGKLSANRGRLIIVNELDSFIEYSMKLAGVKDGNLKGLNILIETLNGSAAAEIALAFEKAGAAIEVRDAIPNGFFPKGDPNPIIESSIKPARDAMKSGSYDFGLCFDGDGDRLDFMAGNGEQIVPGLNMSIIIEKLMSIFNGKYLDVYADVKAVPVALSEIAKRGANVHIIRNGHSFIKAKLLENERNGYFAAEEESAHYYMNFPYDIDDFSKGFASVENTLFFSLITAKAYKENPDAYKRAYELQKSIYREREWSIHFDKAPEKMEEVMREVEGKMRSLGALVIKTMDDGSDLDATLMRFNLPESFDRNTSLDDRIWCQVASRISRSEDNICRFDIISNDKKECERINSAIKAITDRYVAEGFAEY